MTEETKYRFVLIDQMEAQLAAHQERLDDLERRVDVLMEMMEESVAFAKNMSGLLVEMRNHIVGEQDDNHH